MTDTLLSLRALVVSHEKALCDLLWNAAALSPLPLEIVACADATAACDALAAGVDLIYLDGALAPADTARVVAAATAAAKPPFTVQLAAGAAAQSFVTDALAGRPSRPEEANWLIERSIRVQVPTRVLVVDDSATMRSIVRKALAATRFRFEVSEAAEGLAALKLVREGDFQGLRQQHKRRNGCEVSSLHVGSDGFGFVLTPSVLPSSLPQNVSNFRPKNVGHNEFDFAVDVAPEQAERLVGQRFPRRRNRPRDGDAAVKDYRVQRSRSSRIISSAEGNGPGLKGGRARSSASRS